MKEVGIDEAEFENYYQKLEESKVENNNLEVKDYQLIAEFQKKTNGIQSGHVRKILEIQKEWKNQMSQCDEVELYIIKAPRLLQERVQGLCQIE